MPILPGIRSNELYQRRFISQTADDYFELLYQTEKLVNNTANSKLGIGIHSLRAVSPEAICEILNQLLWYT